MNNLVLLLALMGTYMIQLVMNVLLKDGQLLNHAISVGYM